MVGCVVPSALADFPKAPDAAQIVEVNRCQNAIQQLAQKVKAEVQLPLAVVGAQGKHLPMSRRMDDD